MIDDGEPCPCGRDRAFGRCCARILRGERAAATAEELMRSRYAAFAVGDVAHLHRSWHPDTRPADVRVVPETRWTKLTVVAVEGGDLLDATGIVEFVAEHERRGRTGEVHERSSFARHEERWVYVGPTT